MLWFIFVLLIDIIYLFLSLLGRLSGEGRGSKMVGVPSRNRASEKYNKINNMDGPEGGGLEGNFGRYQVGYNWTECNINPGYLIKR